MKEENGVDINQNMTDNNLEETVEMPALAQEYVESLQENNTNNDSSQNMGVPSPEETVPVLEAVPTSNEVNQNSDTVTEEANSPIEFFTEVPIQPAVITPIDSANESANETNQPVDNAPLNVMPEQPIVDNSVPATPLEAAPIMEVPIDTNTVSEVTESNPSTETLTMVAPTDVTMNTNPTMNLEQSVPVQENTNETVVTPVMDNNMGIGMADASLENNMQEVTNPTEVSLTPNNNVTQNESMTVIPQEAENQDTNNSSNSKKNSILIGIIVTIVIILLLGVVWFVVF